MSFGLRPHSLSRLARPREGMNFSSRRCVLWSSAAWLFVHLSMHHSLAIAQRFEDPSNDSGDSDYSAACGRTFGEQQVSPLSQMPQTTVKRVGLTWFHDLDSGNSATVPLAIDGVLYFASGRSAVYALDAVSGQTLWTFDSKVEEVAGPKLNQGQTKRALAWCNGTLYSRTYDGRLIVLNAKTGTVQWTAGTFPQDDLHYITGAPRVVDGKLIIGHGGADSASARSRVIACDAKSGKFLRNIPTPHPRNVGG